MIHHKLVPLIFSLFACKENKNKQLKNVCPGQLGPVIYRPGHILPTFFRRDASKSLREYDWFYLYCWSVKLVSINGSDFTTVRETDKKYIFELFILIFFTSKKRKNQRY